MATLSDIYKLRTEAEANISAQLTAAGLSVVTRANQPQNFQQVRPRVEIKVKIGGVTGHLNVCPDGLARYDEYRITLGIQTVVRPENDGVNATNESYLGKVRALISTLAQYSFNDNTNFPNLFLCVPFKDSGTEDTLKTEEGVEYSALSYDSIVKIRETAWPTP